MIAGRETPQVLRGVAVVGALALGATWWLVDVPTAIPTGLGVVDIVLLVLAAVVMEQLPIRLPDGRASVPTSFAVLGAAAVLGTPPPLLALIAAIAWTVARLVDRTRPGMRALAARTLGAWSLAGAAALGVVVGPGVWTGPVDDAAAAWVHVGAALGVTVALLLGVPMLGAVARSWTGARFLLLRSSEAVRENALVGTAVVATAVLGALVHPVLRHWTLPAMLIPLLAARVGLERFSAASRAYDQTLRAMSRLPEQLDSVSEGHGVRVAELAGAVALELGMDARIVSDIVRASHLHEVGRIQLERDVVVTQRELAAAGARVLGSSRKLARVADMVAAHGQLHDAHALEGDTRRGALVLAACCEVDRYAPDPRDAGQRHEVVVRLVREIGDLEVVAALTRVLDRAGDRLLPASNG